MSASQSWVLFGARIETRWGLLPSRLALLDVKNTGTMREFKGHKIVHVEKSVSQYLGVEYFANKRLFKSSEIYIDFFDRTETPIMHNLHFQVWNPM